MFNHMKNRQEREAIRKAGQLLTNMMEYDERQRFAAHFAETRGIPYLKAHLNELSTASVAIESNSEAKRHSKLPMIGALAGIAAGAAILASSQGDPNMMSLATAVAAIGSSGVLLRNFRYGDEDTMTSQHRSMTARAKESLYELERFVADMKSESGIASQDDINRVNKAIERAMGHATVDPAKSKLGNAHEPYHNLGFDAVRDALGEDRAEELFEKMEERIDGMAPEQGAVYRRGYDRLVTTRRMDQTDKNEIRANTQFRELIQRTRAAGPFPSSQDNDSAPSM